jgi:hypothetical protein
MKLHWLAALLVVASVVVGCTPERPAAPVVKQAVAQTPPEALQIVDKAIADMETAFQGTNTEAMASAAHNLQLAMGTLTAVLSQKEQKESVAAHKVGTTPPPSVLNQLGPATSGANQMQAALIDTPPDVTKAKSLLPQVKATIDTIRGALK